jgi:hypothetical protein
MAINLFLQFGQRVASMAFSSKPVGRYLRKVNPSFRKTIDASGLCPSSDAGTKLARALSGLKNRRCVMKPMPEARENRRFAEIQKKKAENLLAGAAKDSRLKKARDHESSAHASDWRNSTLQAPE